MRIITAAEYESFLAERCFAAIHFDAEWDVGHRPPTRLKMLEAEHALGHLANFAEMDVDKNGALAKSIRIMNVPVVAYYRDATLVAALIGAGQDVRTRMERLMRGESIGYDDGTSRR
ncbi:MAG: thioredoxin family protein [Planctomycetota bacterium]|nr:thioredoxin family protein [Planctomycetota bacterium]